MLPSPLRDSLPPYLISRDQLIQGRDLWELIVGSSTALTPLFATSSNAADSRLTGVSFPIEQIEELLSTVGGDEVRVHFLATGAGSTADPYAFRIALSVAGLQGVGSESRRQLSAYYVAEAVASAASVARLPDSPVTGIPLPLVGRWIRQWEDAETLNSAMFCNLGAPLHGYTYPIKDFVRALFAAQPAASPDTLYLLFGLHHYYAMDEEGDVSAQRQFGVIMTLDNGLAPAARTYFDMSKPCPPICGDGL